MPINAVLREKRKALGYTQEQLAQALGVTAPAVNKWEKGATYPDVALLSPLARLLKVDLNTLLCFQEEPSGQEIRIFLTKLSDTLRASGFSAGLALGLEKAREYPLCGELLHQIALVLDGSLLMADLPAGEKEAYASQVVALYERAAQCGESAYAVNAAFMLASKYINSGEYDRAQEMLDRLPEYNPLDKRDLQAALLVKRGQLTQAAELTERKLLTALNGLLSLLWSLSSLAEQEGERARSAEIAESSRQAAELFGLWDYASCVGPFLSALSREDVPDTLSALHAMLSALRTPWSMGDSPLFCHIAPQSPAVEPQLWTQRILPPMLAELESAPQYAFLRSHEEFWQLIRSFRAQCRS